MSARQARVIVVPQSFRDMPRWWRQGTGWLDALPGMVEQWCSRWGLSVCGEPMHGSHALVVPVRRADGEFVLRLTPPGPEVVAQVEALRFWGGRGVVRLFEADTGAGAMLLERLGGLSLAQVPVEEAMEVLGRLMRRLAVGGTPLSVPCTGAVVTARAGGLEESWELAGRPFPRSVLGQGLEAGARLVGGGGDVAVNGDLHAAQVLGGGVGEWTVVDPVLMRGDIAFDLGRVLWTRLDEMTDVVRHFDVVVAAAGLERDRGRDWVLFRAVDYWVWCVGAGLTEDPERCRRLVGVFGV